MNRLGLILVALSAVPLSALCQAGGLPSLALDPVVQGPERPTGIHAAGDGSGRLFLMSKNGRIEIFDGTALLPQPFLDIDARVNSSGVERGLHGLAFDPDYAVNGFFYVVYTNLASDSIISRFSVTADPDIADPNSETILLEIDQPDQYHNVSQLQFGSDGYLYIGAGDGGFIGDPDNRAQNLGELLGKILRIDVSAAPPYSIPPDNPFVGVPGAQPEIWAYGVRNPWRFSFDRVTGDMYMGDVGQWSWEEVNFQPGDSSGGENYGWRLMEGAHCYNPSTGCEQPDLVMPILEFSHSTGCAVTGGYVYRGERFPRLDGTYYYSDWCSGRVWGARQESGVWVNNELLDTTLAPTTFGENDDGELFLADDDNGTIYRLIDPEPFCDLRMSQPDYSGAETVTMETLRLVNLGGAGAAGRLQLFLVTPGGGIPLLDVGGDGSLVLGPGTDFGTSPIPLFAANAVPAGSYAVACRLSNAGTGATYYFDANPFTVLAD